MHNFQSWFVYKHRLEVELDLPSNITGTFRA